MRHFEPLLETEVVAILNFFCVFPFVCMFVFLAVIKKLRNCMNQSRLANGVTDGRPPPRGISSRTL